MKSERTTSANCSAQQPALRFRRWSRKRYAAFISRKQIVTIGHLAAAVADRFYLKGLSLHKGISCFMATDLLVADREVDDSEEVSLWSLFVERALALLCPLQRETIACSASGELIQVCIEERRGESERVLPAFLVFNKLNK